MEIGSSLLGDDHTVERSNEQSKFIRKMVTILHADPYDLASTSRLDGIIRLGCKAIDAGIVHLLQCGVCDRLTNSLLGSWEIGRARVGKECRSRWSPYH